MSRPRTLNWLDAPRDDTGVEMFDEASHTYRPYTELADAAGRIAGGLIARGVPRGAVVPLLCSTGPDLVAAFYGVQAAGCVVSVLAPPTRMSGEAARAHVRAVVTAVDAGAVVADAAHHDYAVDVLAGTGTGTGSGSGARVLLLEELAAAEAGRRDPVEQALVQFTSGSSGRPRGVRVSHAALDANTAAIRAWERAGRDDSWCSWLPMHHDMGLIGCLVVPVSGNNRLAVCRPETFLRHPLVYLTRFDAKRVERPATITATPAFGLKRIVDKVGHADLEGADLSRTRAVIVGAERIDPALVTRFTELMRPHGLDPHTLTPAYGLAESTLAVTGVPVEEEPRSVLVHRDELRVGAQVSLADGRTDRATVQVMSCGRALDGLTVRVVGEDGEPLPEGHVGELAVTGSSLADGYLTDGSAEGTAFAGGRLLTRDVAFELAGEFYVLGRLGDSVKVHARSLFAEDVELMLGRAGLDLSRVCVVLGEADGQPHAVAVLEGLDTRAAKVAEEVLAAACPGTRRHVAQVPRGAIPRTSSGKSRRRRLWQRLSQERALDAVSAAADSPA
ncbi:AMP-binding protein [Streptomyces sp. TRM68416]|uniref:AMP-binding protein n=1 Tax=Streptomyces sp. TRM68416 TaxID=2758412 RepID=UPI001661AD8E|nr:AMP-binding protein [Streptomyces sp. TRM68416]MBD0842856.1 AMP-binding protein [Streptomyces sp. TRM68416]